MKIINAMFGKGLGGIEQALIDHAEALASCGHEVVCVVQPNAKIISEVEKIIQKFPEQVSMQKIANFGEWDFFAKAKINQLVAQLNPTCVIAHGNRPAGLFEAACKKNNVPLIGIAHNYRFKNFKKCNFVIAVNSDIRNKIIAQGFAENKIVKLQNMIRLQALEPNFKPFSAPPVIGVIGRFVEAKAFDVFIKAIAELNKINSNFTAIIAGDGAIREDLQKLRDDLKLNEKLKFIGWVKNKEIFYSKIDIFCLSSRLESFGIALLEAMSFKKPIVSTKAEGPVEIFENNLDALLVEKEDARQMALALNQLLINQQLAQTLSENAYKKLQSTFNISVVGKILEATIKNFLIKKL